MAPTVIQRFPGQVDMSSNLVVNTVIVESNLTANTIIVESNFTANTVIVESNLTVNTNTLHVDSVTGQVGIGTNTPASNLHINGTGAMIVPTGTTLQRPPTGIEGMFRFNSQTTNIEWYTPDGWTTATVPTPVIQSFTPKSIAYANVATEVITLTGQAFDAESTISLEGADGTLYDTTDFTFTDSNTVSFKIGALAEGQAANRPYKLLLTNGTGRIAKSDTAPGFTPTWTSPASDSTQYAGTVSSNPITLSASDGVGGSSVTYSVVGSLPSGLSISGNTISGISMAPAGSNVSVTIRATDAFGSSNYSDRTFNIKSVVNAGEVLFDSSGSRTWTVPEGVTSICAVMVGGGGGGGSGSTGTSGAGGGLGYKNHIPVSSGDTVSVTVAVGGGVNASGGTSSITVNSNTYSATGGQGGTANYNFTTGGSPSANCDGGGIGGGGRPRGRIQITEYVAGGGGGAGGYSGNGGHGAGGDTNGTSANDYRSAESGQGGGGGGGSGLAWGSPNYVGTGAGGGGVGLYGQGANGAGGFTDIENTNGIEVSILGLGGSGGANGLGPQANPGSGGKYGGGAGGYYSYTNIAPTWVNYHGGEGGIRIIWGTGRMFPSTNTDHSYSYGNVTTI
jgi:hypothetical protein